MKHHSRILSLLTVTAVALLFVACDKGGNSAEIPTQPTFKMKLIHSGVSSTGELLPPGPDGLSPQDGARPDLSDRLSSGGEVESISPTASVSEILDRPELKKTSEAAALKLLELESPPCSVVYETHLGNEGRVIVIVATGDDADFVKTSLKAHAEAFMAAWDEAQRPEGMASPETLVESRARLETEIEKDQDTLSALAQEFPPAINRPELEGLRDAILRLPQEEAAVAALSPESAAKAQAHFAKRRAEIESRITLLEQRLAEHEALTKTIKTKTEELGEIDRQEAVSTGGSHRSNHYKVVLDATRVDLVGDGLGANH